MRCLPRHPGGRSRTPRAHIWSIGVSAWYFDRMRTTQALFLPHTRLKGPERGEDRYKNFVKRRDPMIPSLSTSPKSKKEKYPMSTKLPPFSSWFLCRWVTVFLS